MDISKYLARYNVNSDDRAVIKGLKKKYGIEIEEENPDMYEFPENEVAMLIPKKNSSLLFPPDLSDREYEKITEKFLSPENEHLQRLNNYRKLCDEQTKKLLWGFFNDMNRCKEKIKEKLSATDDDEKSEVFTGIFKGMIENNLKKILEQCMFKNDRQWKTIGGMIRDYLENTGFYTPDKIENSTRSEYISTQDSYPQITGKKSEHGKIIRFNSLPYCIDYYDENSEQTEKLCISGSCTYYKYEE